MIDQVEKQKRIYQISLLLRRKPKPFIMQFIAQNWELKKRQAYNYIRLAKKEWEEYFTDIKRCGKAYYVAQLRDLKDQAYSRKVAIGRGDNKETVTIADLGLVFEITKEEAKLMGIYPKGEVDVNLKHSGGIDFNEYKNIKEMTEDERKLLIDKLSKICRSESDRPAGENQKKD